MISSYDDSNSIYIPLVNVRGGFRVEFDWTYPNRLNGIIHRNEFHESINNINQPLLFRRTLGFFGTFIFLFVLIGIALCIVGGVTGANSEKNEFPLLAAIGVGIFAFGIVFCVPGCCFVKFRYASKMKEAVAMESMKYSSRSPTPCTWQIIGSRACASGYSCGSFAPVYQLVIEIGNVVPSEKENLTHRSNQIAPQKSSFLMQKSDIPPTQTSFSTRSTVAFCSQCGAPKQNTTAKFCASCGQLLNA